METFRITTNMDLIHQWRTKRIIDGEASSAFGYLPSRTTSGALAQWLLRLLRRGPSLTLFEAGYNARSHPFPPIESPEVLQSLKIQTFVNERNTLVHCWTTAECGLFRFGPHEKSYRVQFRYRPHKRHDPDLYLPQDGAIEHGYNFSPYNVLECVDPYSLVVSPTGSTGFLEFTDYRGLHLPFVLLDYVYSQIKVERMPSRGQRGLSLPPHVWQVLDDWCEQVQSIYQLKFPDLSAQAA
jgi:hypothetical protein